VRSSNFARGTLQLNVHQASAKFNDKRWMFEDEDLITALLRRMDELNKNREIE